MESGAFRFLWRLTSTALSRCPLVPPARAVPRRPLTWDPPFLSYFIVSVTRASWTARKLVVTRSPSTRNSCWHVGRYARLLTAALRGTLLRGQLGRVRCASTIEVESIAQVGATSRLHPVLLALHRLRGR